MTQQTPQQLLEELYQLRQESRAPSVGVNATEASARYETAKAAFEAQYPGNVERMLDGIRESKALAAQQRAAGFGAKATAATGLQAAPITPGAPAAPVTPVAPVAPVTPAAPKPSISPATPPAPPPAAAAVHAAKNIEVVAEKTATVDKIEATIEAANSRKPGWINRVSKTKLAVATAGAIGAVGVGVWAWKEYIAKPEPSLPHARTK